MSADDFARKYMALCPENRMLIDRLIQAIDANDTDTQKEIVREIEKKEKCEYENAIR